MSAQRPVSDRHYGSAPYEPRNRAGLLASQQAKGCLILVALGVIAVAVFVGVSVAGRAYLPQNDALVVEDVRMVMLAEEKYAAANGGHYGRIECLVRPTDCIPSYPQDGPSFLDGSEREIRALRRGSRGFWSLRFIPGPPVDGNESALNDLQSYAFVANPAFDGLRSFCADSTGTFCVVSLELGDGPAIVNGKCDDPACLPIE
jgi:hypothetical protein